MSGNTLDFLVDETFRLNELSATPLESIITDGLKAPDTPGVIYLIDRSKFVTQLKLSESPNLLKDFTELSKASHPVTNLNYFEVNSYSDAQYLSRTFNRFKVMKKSVELNSQDYNQVWWGGLLESGEVLLSFDRKPYRNIVEKYELGPMGDSALAKYYFTLLAKKSTLSVVEKGSSLIFNSVDKSIMNSFKDFLLGKTDKIKISLNEESCSGLELLENLSLKSFFKELSLSRNFWIAIADQLSEQSISIH